MVALDQIIKECKRYNKFAQKLLYEKYAPGMNGVCLRYINDTDAVKDIVQEGFIVVFAKIKQYSGTGSFEGWMKRIFINMALTYIRQQQKKGKYLNIEDVEESELIDETASSSEQATIIDKIDVNEKEVNFQMIRSADFSESELLKALEQLPIKYRIVFNLSCIENFKHEEIAKMLNIDISSSRTRLLRARQMIQKELYEMSIEKISI